MALNRKPVPWDYLDNNMFKTWTWETPHFLVRVIAEGEIGAGASFTWSISEKKNDKTYLFEQSTSRSFREAELEIVEIIAKSWDKKLGYSEYAGDLATTFEIYGGKKINFENYLGEKVRLTYNNDDGLQIKTGLIGIKNYSILLKLDDNQIMVIPPAKIKEIVQVK